MTRRSWWPWAAAFAVGGIALFAAYVRLSATYPVNSDGANIVLMAWDMLHGNPALHGWWLSDVSFYTTELPQYMLLELIRGLSPDVTHLAAAMTYTLALVLAALLAKGRAAGREGVIRVLVAAGVMLAPQPGAGVFVLLLSVGHIGTAVPVLLIWLILDRARPRWYIPVLTGALLTWAAIADSLVLVIAVAPLVLVAGFRARQRLLRDGRPAWYELSLAAAALAAAAASEGIDRLIHAAGGYYLHQVPYRLAPAAAWPHHLRVTVQGVLALFGANLTGLPSGPAVVFAVIHLAGLAAVLGALGRAAWTFACRAALADQVLAVAIVVNLALYVPSTLASGVLNAREFAIILPFGAALAGRMLGPRLQGAGRARPDWRARPAGRARPLLLAGMAGLAALAVLAGYGAALAYGLAQPPAPPANARLAAWLEARHLDHGLSGYWQASSVTLDSGGRVTVRAVADHSGGLVPYRWETKRAWFDPAIARASFVVLDSQPGFFSSWGRAASVRDVFGPPAATYRTGPYTVLLYRGNLLQSLREWGQRTG
jgi:hypothetical protein